MQTNYGELPIVVDQTTGRARLRREDRQGPALKPGTGACQQRPDALQPTYASKTEAAYASYLEALKYGHVILAWWYQPFRLYLPGGVTYRPDFLVQTVGDLCIHEVKGWSKNLRDGMSRFKIAAGFYPCFHWCCVRKVKRDWVKRWYP